MIILGHVGIQSYYNKVSSASTRSALEKIAERLLARQPQNYNQPNVDRVELSSSAEEYARMHGYEKQTAENRFWVRGQASGTNARSRITATIRSD